MRTTLVIEVSDELSDFINGQQGLVDPSAFINKLLHDEARRRGESLTLTPNEQPVYDNEVKRALEEYLDQQTPAAD